MEYPDQYLHITYCQSGETEIVPLDEETPLDLHTLVCDWILKRFDGELVLDGELMPKLDGEYYTAIYTDGREPDCGIVWESGGFYLKGASECH